MKEGTLVVVLVGIISAITSAEKNVKFKNQEQCQVPPDTGLCGTSGTVRRWFYNADTAQCETFRWGFCGDQNNVFRSRSICERYCITVAPSRDSTTGSGNSLSANLADSELTQLMDTTTTSIPSTTTTTTTIPTPTPVSTCAPNDCSLLSCSGSVVTSFEPDSGCPTCHCVVSDVTETHVQRDDAPEVEQEDVVISEELPVEEDPCEYCDEMCRQADTIRDLSEECEFTHCRCTSYEDNASQATSMCSELPVECICSEYEVATSAVDENGCDVCRCVESELRDDNHPILISTSEFVCPEIECSLTCDNENGDGGFESDENGCHLCACRNHQAIEEDQMDTVVAPATELTPFEADAEQEVVEPCMDLSQCSVSCPFGYQVDTLTGCEICECHHLVPSDENSDDDYGAEDDNQQTDVSAPSLCQPEVGCDTDTCIRAFDPTAKCDLCICDDFGEPEVQVETNNEPVDSETDREVVDAENESSERPDVVVPEAEDKDNDDACVNQLSCNDDCYPTTDDLGCIVECHCPDNMGVVTSPPLTDMNSCPEHVCSCDEGFETVEFTDHDGCPACACHPAEEVEEEEIVPVTASRQGVDDREEVDEELIVPVTALPRGRDWPVQPSLPRKENVVSLQVAEARKVWCSLLPERGPCQATLERWFHDRTSGTCTAFTYSGCRGNANNFRSEMECQRYCKPEIDTERNEKQNQYKRILGFEHQ